MTAAKVWLVVMCMGLSWRAELERFLQWVVVRQGFVSGLIC
jgi:hypothetical protein